jgi:hypothetical protein
MPGYYNEAGKWVETQYDPHAAPGSNPRPARGEGGLGSNAESDTNYALEQNKQAKLAPAFHPLESVQNNKMNAEEARLLYQAAMGWKPTATATHAAAPTINRSAEGESKAMQMAMLARIAEGARGGGPSVSNALHQGATDDAMRAQMAAGKGGGALANRAVMGAGAGMHSDNAAKFGAMRAGEQQNAWGSLANAAFGARGADLTGDVDQARLNMQAAMANAGADQAVSFANQRGSLQALQNQTGAASLYGGVSQDQFNAELGFDQMRNAKYRHEAEKRRREEQAEYDKWATGMKVVGTMAAFASDERVKTNVKPGDKRLRAWLDAIAAHEYEYKDNKITGTAPGKHVSPMAQELEKSDIGKRAVFDAPEGHKMVDYSRMAPAQLAATAWLHKRLTDLEGKKK